MIAEILSTGDEIRTGAVLDSNAAYLAATLEECGIHVQRYQGVGDDLNTIAELLTEIGRRAEVAVVTGGLGPTQDDVTAEAAALAAGVSLSERTEALDMIEAYFAKRGRPFTPANRKQALLPDTARILPNPIGTAPGFELSIETCRFYFLPGVPVEMEKMMIDHVVPGIRVLAGQTATAPVQTSRISTFGLPEAMVAEKLIGFKAQFKHVRLGLCTEFPEIVVKLYPDIRRSSESGPEIVDAAKWVSERLGKVVLSTRGESLPAVVGTMLRKQSARLAVAESCTGGLLAHLLTGVAGSSDYFLFSAVTYANQSKMDVLGVSAGTLQTCGAVHEATAREMAAGVRRLSGADYGLSTTGIAGPSGGTAEKPVGTVCIGLADRNGETARRFQLNFDNRSMNKRIFAFTALDQLRRALL